MKKSVIATIGGVVLGIVLMLGVFSILNMRPMNEDILAQNEEVETEEEISQNPKWELDLSVDLEDVTEELETEDTEKEDMEEEKVAETNIQSTPATTVTQLPYYIRVNRQANCVTVYTLDAEGNYTIPIKAMTCSVGLNNATPLGVSKISDRYTWRLLFGNVYGHYAVRFNGHILFHSVPYMSPSNDTLKEGQFNLLGQPASQGCIRLCIADAKWIYDNCAKGTIVEVYDSPDPGPLGKPAMPQISAESPFRGWDPTDPNTANPWHYGSVTIQGVKDLSVEAGGTIDLLSEVSATDVDGLEIAVTVDGEIDFSVPGSYNITYSTTGVLGHTATVNAVVTVLPVGAGELKDGEVETELPENQEIVPPSTQETVPPSTEEAVPPSTEEVVPPSTQEVVPPSTQEAVPPSTQEVVPSSTEETAPPSTQEVVPPSTEETAPPSTQEVVPPSTEETAPPSTQEVVPSSTQEAVPTSTDEVVPSSTQEIVPQSTQESVE